MSEDETPKTSSDNTFYDDEVDSTPSKPVISNSMRERLIAEASAGLDADSKQPNVLLYIMGAVVILVALGGQGIFFWEVGADYSSTESADIILHHDMILPRCYPDNYDCIPEETKNASSRVYYNNSYALLLLFCYCFHNVLLFRNKLNHALVEWNTVVRELP